MGATQDEMTPKALDAGAGEKGATEAHNDAEDTHLNELGWDGLDDPRDPYNWSTWRKVSIAVVFSTNQLVTLMTASMMASALGQISTELNMSASLTQMSFSIYILGLALGPFLIGPLSEVYGRRSVWIISNVWYIFWNSLCPVGPSQGMLLVGRFLAGFSASSGVALTPPALADMFRSKDRGKSIAVAAFLPYLGPALGPILGGIVSQHLRWPILFWIMSGFDAAVLLVGIFFLRETCAAVLLRRKADAEGTPDKGALPRPFSRPYFAKVFAPVRIALLRPIKLLLYRPLTVFISLNLAISFAMYFLVLSTFATMWIDRYQESESVSSLHYISIALGATMASQVGGPLMDWMFRFQKARSPTGEETPEFRVPYMIAPLFLFPAGLIWYGWAAEARAAWIVVDMGAFFFTFTSFMYSQGYQAYMLDEFTHTASATAAVRLLSNVMAFVFPLFATQLYDRLGYGWGNSLLALVFAVFSFPSVVVLWFWGPQLRAIGKSEETN